MAIIGDKFPCWTAEQVVNWAPSIEEWSDDTAAGSDSSDETKGGEDRDENMAKTRLVAAAHNVQQALVHLVEHLPLPSSSCEDDGESMGRG